MEPLEIDSDSSEIQQIANYINKMNIKDYVTENYKWLYGVTYWLGSGNESSEGNKVEAHDYYISNEGLLCALGRGLCVYLPYPIGNGVRPLVTIDA